MGKSAASMTQWLSHPSRFADLYNGTVFHGTQVVCPDDLELAKGESHVLLDDKMKQTQELRRYRDITMRWNQKNHITLAILACENQDKVHPGMPVRNMLYDSLSYREQMALYWNRLSEEEKKQCSSAEYLARYRAQDKLTPVITLVLYYGDDTWTASTELYDMLELDGLIEEHPELKHFIQNYQINLIDVSHLEDTSIFQTDLQQVFDVLKYKCDKNKLDNYIRQNPAYFNHVDKETALLFGELLNSDMILNSAELIQEGDTMSMCKALEDLYNDGVKEGEELGEERFANLTSLLLTANRIDDLKRASEDSEFRNGLFEEFNI